MTTLYKVTAEAGTPYHGGTGAWPLPQDGKPCKWRSVKGEIVPCVNGLHMVTLEQLPQWLGPVIWEGEFAPRAEIVEQPDKLAGSKARLVRRVEAWNERTARLFAADCAEHVLPLFEKHYPDDRRPRAAIEAARAFANGAITRDELVAAWAAARAAARAAAWDAAGAAAGVAAWAAWDAAGAAAGVAAWAAARAAARAAAWVAAWDAAQAAGAAWDAAQAAEISWQATCLGEYLAGTR